MHLFGRVRKEDEMYGQYRQLLLCRASDKETHEKGQDGGFVGAMLIWLMKNDYIDADNDFDKAKVKADADGFQLSEAYAAVNVYEIAKRI